MAFRFESPLLRAYWISFSVGQPNSYGMGVTAFDERDALELVRQFVDKKPAVEPKEAKIRKLTSEDEVPGFGSGPYRYATAYFRGVWTNNTGLSLSGDGRRIGRAGD